MKRFAYKIDKARPDAMGGRSVLKITIPLTHPNSGEEIASALSEVQSGLSKAFEETEQLREKNFPISIREAFECACEVADGDAELFSNSREMFAVSQCLQQVIEFIDAAPAKLRTGPITI